MFFRLPPPIPATVKDTEELNKTFDKWKVIPQYGTSNYTSHTLLELIQTLVEMSPTFKAAMKDLNTYIFGRRVMVCSGMMAGLQSDVVELDFADQVEFDTWLKERNIKFRNVLKLSRRMNSHLEANSNTWLYVRRITSGDAIRYDMKVKHYKHVFYYPSQDIGQEFVLITKWITDKQKMEKFPPKILPVTKNGETIVWHNAGDGVQEAIIHIQKEDQDGESDYYSRSDLIPILTWLYVDFQVGNLNSKTSATEMISKKILAFQAPDPAAIEEEEQDEEVLEELVDNDIAVKVRKPSMFRRNMAILKELVTNLSAHPSLQKDGSKSASIAGLEYPHSGVPPTPIDLEMNRDTKHQEFQVEKAVRYICTVLGWSPELLGVQPTKTNLGGNLLYDLFTMKNEATVRPRANYFEDLWNDLFDQIKELDGAPAVFNDYGICFPDVIAEMIAKFKGDNKSANIGENPVRDSTIENSDNEDFNDSETDSSA